MVGPLLDHCFCTLAFETQAATTAGLEYWHKKAPWLLLQCRRPGERRSDCEMSVKKTNVILFRAALYMVVLVGFALRILSLAHRSLWFDESMEFWVATSPLLSLLPNVRIALQDPPLYSLLLHFWMVGGHQEFWLRFLSLMLSMLGVLGVIKLARLTSGRFGSLAAGLLTAVSVPDIRFAQEVGQYALMIAVLSWHLVFWIRFIRTGKWQSALLYGISGAVALYSYYGTAITIVVSGLLAVMVVWFSPKRSALLWIGVIGVLCVGLVSPLVLKWLPEQLLKGPTTNALQVRWAPLPDEGHRFLVQTKQLVGYQLTGVFPGRWPWQSLPEWVVWVPVLALCLASLGEPTQRLLAAALLFGILLSYVLGRLGVYPYGTRYSLVLAPLFWTVVGGGIATLARLYPLGYVPLVLIVSLSLVSPLEPQEDLRSAADFWKSNSQPADVTYVYYGAVPGFRYQLELADGGGPLPPLWYHQCWGGEATDSCVSDDIFYGSWIRNSSVDEKKQSIMGSIGGSPDRLWLVFSHIHQDEDDAIVSVLSDDYRALLDFQAENARAILLVHNTQPSAPWLSPPHPR